MTAAGTNTVRVVVVDDHEMVRVGIGAMLGVDGVIEVCGDAANCDDAMEIVRVTQPDVALVDVRLGDESGIELVRQLRRASPTTRVVMMTALAREQDLFAAMAAGASGYLVKHIRRGDLVDALSRVAAGETLFDDGLVERVMERLRDDTPHDPLLARLSERERDVLALIARGRTNKEIAEGLHLSEKTVKNHLTRLLARMGMSSRTEAAAYWAANADAPPD